MINSNCTSQHPDSASAIALYPNPSQKAKELSIINFTGNVIPDSWYNHLKNPAGKKGESKPNLPAIIILSEILSWYRLVEVRCKDTGKSKGLFKRYKGDLLQKSHASLGAKFGLSLKQTKSACYFLQEKNLIKLVNRTVTTSEGRKLPNTLFIDINPKEIAKITSLEEESHQFTFIGSEIIESRYPSKAELLCDREILNLPSKKLSRSNDLPGIPAIYFAISDDQEFLYIGQTQNLKKRWNYRDEDGILKPHHRHWQLSQMGQVRIHYQFCPVDQLDEFEAAYIEQLQPTLNNTRVIKEAR